MNDRKDPTFPWTAPPKVSRAARRLAAAPGVRRYMAARPDRLAGRFGLGAPWPREDTRRDLRGLISHARHAAQNIDYLKSYEMMVRRHVVGRKGITLQMDIRDPATGKADPAANRLIESAWSKWGKRGNCTICGRLSWWNVENVGATMRAREGNFLLRTRTGQRRGPFGFQVQVLSVDLLDVDMVDDLGGGSYVDGGIEFDDDGKVLAFHLFTAHPLTPRHAAGSICGRVARRAGMLRNRVTSPVTFPTSPDFFGRGFFYLVQWVNSRILPGSLLLLTPTAGAKFSKGFPAPSQASDPITFAAQAIASTVWAMSASS